jgi:hypothetical protein
MTTVLSDPVNVRIAQAAGAWVTAHNLQQGQVRVVSDATMGTVWDVNPCQQGGCIYVGGTYQRSMGWSSAAYAPDLGALGSLILWTGGDVDYWGNEVKAFDIESGRWRLLTNPSLAFDNPPVPRIGSALDSHWDLQYAEHVAANGDRTPGVPHNYDDLLALPASAPHAGLAGSLLATHTEYPFGQSIYDYTHACDLYVADSTADKNAAGPLAWSRPASNRLGPVPNSGTCAYDPVRNYVWWSAQSTKWGGYLDLNVWPYVHKPQVGTGSGGDFGANCAWVPKGAVSNYIPARGASADGVVMSGWDVLAPYNFGLWHWNINAPFSDGAFTRLNISGDVPFVDAELYNITSTWCDDLECLIVYREEPYSKTRVWHVAPPAAGNPLTGTWSSVSHTFAAGSDALNCAYPAAEDRGARKRFIYAPSVQCVLYVPWDVSAPVYAYRPFGL